MSPYHTQVIVRLSVVTKRSGANPGSVMQNSALSRLQRIDRWLGGLESGALVTTIADAESAHGDVLVANFTIGAAGHTFHDTAVIRDDRFLVLTTVNYPAA